MQGRWKEHNIKSQLVAVLFISNKNKLQYSAVQEIEVEVEVKIEIEIEIKIEIAK